MLRAVTPLVVLTAPLATATGQQGPDPAFRPAVANPAYTRTHPRVAIDNAHVNLHNAQGSYAPFATLLKLDGYEVSSNDAKFSAAALKNYDVLIVANARAGAGIAFADSNAFTADEVAAVDEWVRGGGALLLVADHAPFGGAAESLARAFGVGMAKGVTQDTAAANHATANPTFLRFSRDNRLLGQHPIIAGRNTSESVGAVVTFSGQSLTAPPGAIPLLMLSPTALDRAPPTRVQNEARADRLNRVRDSIQAARAAGGGGDSAIAIRGQPSAAERGTPVFTSAAGRAQAVALKHGKGRVVVLGEAALLSAQLIEVPGQPTIRMGMQVPGSDDQQFALNVMHWLSGLMQ